MDLSNQKNRIILTITFLIYTTLLFTTILNHELWGDEIHSWNIAKCSYSFSDLLYNIRYEGHPPVWYLILWSLSKWTHHLVYIQIIQGCIACVSIFILLFFSPFPITTKLLLPFGYYFLYEYGVLSRNYTLGIALAFCICLLINNRSENKLTLYYLLLFVLSNVHLLAAFLAVSFHGSFLFTTYFSTPKRQDLWKHFLLGVVILFPSFYFIFPPSESGLNMDFWLKVWKPIQLITFIKAPFRAFAPIPAWWKSNFWNSHFLLSQDNGGILLKCLNSLIAFVLVGACIFILKNSKRALILFLMNTGLTFVFSIVFQLEDARYVGFLFIGFVVATWYLFTEQKVSVYQKIIIHFLFVLQLFPICFVIKREIEDPFSNGFQAKNLLEVIPIGGKVVTDYWCLNYLSAYTDQPYYCIDLMSLRCFVKWDTKTTLAATTRSPYTLHFQQYLRENKIGSVYFVTTLSQHKLEDKDPMLNNVFKVSLINKKDNSIQPNSNLYLFKIEIL